MRCNILLSVKTCRSVTTDKNDEIMEPVPVPAHQRRVTYPRKIYVPTSFSN
jgi:hypothetical protein